MRWKMKKTLFPHQLLAIEKMEEREDSKLIVQTTYKIHLNTSIYADIAGYGKTAAMLGLIIRDKMKWDIANEHVQSFISGVYGSGCIVKHNLLSMKRIDTNLIVAGPSLIPQWIRELDETTLKYSVVSSRKKLEQINPSEYDIVLCAPAFYNLLLERFPSYAWKRFLYDEPTHTRISSMRQIIAGFIWFITATPELLLQQYRYSYNFISTIFTQYMDYTLYKNLIIKNDDDYVMQSFALPPIHEYFHECFEPVFHTVRDLISPPIMEMISAGNIEGVVRTLGGDSTSNLYDLIEKDKQSSIVYANTRIERFEAIQDDERAEKWRQRLVRLMRELDELKERVHLLITSTPCPICIERKQEPILLTCCQNIFCGQCVLKWLQSSNSCPMCRRHITSHHLVYISSSDAAQDTENIHDTIPPSSVPPKLSKIDTILKILNDARHEKIIIFSSFQETFDLIRNTLKDHDFTFGEIRGSIATREKIIKDFKSGSMNILFLNSIDSGAGLDLPEATHIILFHQTSGSMFTQLRGRAYRIGRSSPLHIHHLT